MNVVQEHISHPDQSFRVLKLDLAAFRGARHRHRQVELTWIEAGAGLRLVGDSVQPFNDGDLVLLGPGVPHAWISARHLAGRPHRATVLQFAPELLDVGVMPELAAARSLLGQAGRGLQIDDAAKTELLPLLLRLPGQAGLQALATWMDVLACLVAHRAAMTPLASPASRQAIDIRPEQDRRVARLVDWVHRHMASPITVEAAAHLVHVSPGAFSRYFAREMGKGFVEYVNDVRCGEACLRLRSGDKPVAQIAQECGFESTSNFNRQFKLRTGLTPRAFRCTD